MNQHKEKYALIIDDDEISSFLTRRLLEREFYFAGIKVCHSVSEADDCLRGALAGTNPKPDYIFLDLYMPVKSGLEFLDSLHTEIRDMLQDSKIVLLTSNSSVIPAKYRDILYSVSEKPLTKNFIEKLMSEPSTGNTI